MHRSLSYVIIFGIGCILGCSLMSLTARRGGMNEPHVEKSDTVVVYRRVEGTNASRDAMELKRWDIEIPSLAIFTDTIVTERVRVVNDTIYVPISQSFYSLDEGRLRIWASGYKVNIDRWEVDERTRTITNTMTRHWNFSVGVGPGVMYAPFSRKVDVGVGVWGGVSYCF